ncbi:fluoride efflux transporter CrcB [Roseiflexus castenholzii]|uniref:Fluoride-specific ion channel FluC n=1 Tax=Roseiflexus castenholzii (strain DSM 13941 / HLO8) TaxID=383372 RepID=A7NMY5_ROSCS|nr:fluoride efflux transporter CrcB [Roseiflexus castenholzii]ABU58914.1 CrcB protein [Roseiflexus castenholzii DSM 13941]
MVNSALLNAIAIAVGAAIGANLRYSLSLWAAQRWGASFPYGTLIVNVIGSFLIGLVLVLATTRLNLSDLARLLIVTGLLGGFTTFSSLSFETYSLIVSGSWRVAGIYLASSFGLGMAGVFLGAGVARLLP